MSIALVGWALGTRAAPAQAAGGDASGRPGAAKVFGRDDRTYVADMSAFPYSAVGFVQADFGYEIRSGTGALIGRKTVLTVAHVVYDKALGWADSITFIPAKNGVSEPFGRIAAGKTLALRGWTDDHDEQYDIALLVLTREVGEQTGYFQVAVEDDAFFDGGQFSSCGYPADLGGTFPYQVTGSAAGVDRNWIRHTLDSESGQSGAPMWTGSGQVARLVGIIKGSVETAGGLGPDEEWNISTRIMPEFADWIDQSLAEYGDVTQDIAGASASAAAACGGCGAGAGQALAVTLLLWMTLHFLHRPSGGRPFPGPRPSAHAFRGGSGRSGRR